MSTVAHCVRESCPICGMTPKRRLSIWEIYLRGIELAPSVLSSG